MWVTFFSASSASFALLSASFASLARAATAFALAAVFASCKSSHLWKLCSRRLGAGGTLLEAARSERNFARGGSERAVNFAQGGSERLIP